MLTEDISLKEELKSGLVSFTRDKSSDLGSWPIEFFITFYDMLEEDLLRIIEEIK